MLRPLGSLGRSVVVDGYARTFGRGLDGHFGTDVAHPQRLLVEVAQDRAPPPIEARHPAWQFRKPCIVPRRVQLFAPAESNVTSFVDSAEGSVGHEATAGDPEGVDRYWRGPKVLARIARFSFRKRWLMVFAIWLPLLVGLSAISGALKTDYHTDFTQPDSESKRIITSSGDSSPSKPMAIGKSSDDHDHCRHQGEVRK